MLPSFSTARADAAAPAGPHDYLAPVALPFSLPTPIYGAMLALWHLRPDLQRRFPVHKGREIDYLRFLAWCAAEGRRRNAILRAIPEWDEALAKPIVLPSLDGDRWAGAFSVAMFLLGVARNQYLVGPMLSDASARARTARAYWRGGRHMRSLPLAPWQGADLAQRFAAPADLLAAIRLKRADSGKTVDLLVAEFGLGDVVGGFRAPAHAAAADARKPVDVASGAVELPGSARRPGVSLPALAVVPVVWMLGRLGFLRLLRARPSEAERAGVTGLIPSVRRPKRFGDHPFGVNLFGYAKGELGIGEDVRLVAMALEANGIPFCIVDVPLGANVSQGDESVTAWIVDRPRYAINIFCMTGIEMVRYACERGLEVFSGRYTIGFWPWELPDWPTSCRFTYSIVDEIWGISDYAANAYRDAPCPVRPMSLPVVAEPVGDARRADFGLPEGAYLYVFSFDLNSTLSRKNPDGVIRAFQRAFPRGKRENVGLVLKASHSASARSLLWARIKARIATDPRIHLIDRTLRKSQVLALYRCCDCFVSLHRAEGFGRGLAEALLLRKQLVATGYSGNLDFCSEQRVGLVRYELRPLRDGEYFHGTGQRWAEPDVAHAAELMRRVRISPLDAGALAHDFSPENIGRRYSRRLHEIFQSITATGTFEC